ncbi:MAG: SPFH domain-containing protein [Campylobacterales bacterium]
MPVELKDWNGKGGGNSGGGGGSSGGEFQPPKFFQQKSGGLLIFIGILIALGLIFKPFVVINEGEVGILSTTGKFSNTPLQAGMHFYIPVIQRVIIVDTKVHMINYKGKMEAGSMSDRYGTIKIYPPIEVLDARGLPITVELSVSYRLNSNEAPYTIKTYGLNWEDKIINPLVRDVVRNVIGQYKAEELPTKRAEIAKKIEINIKKGLEQLPHHPVLFESFLLRNIILPKRIREQIERVQIAKQEAERAKYEVLKAKQEAEKRATIAKGIAEAKIIQAKGVAKAQLVKAEAEAKANRLISQSLTPELLKLKAIEMEAQFNQAIKANPNVQLFVMPPQAEPKLWLNLDQTRKKPAPALIEGE